MITANEAKRITDDAPNEYIEQIDAKIRESANSGTYECDYVLYANGSILNKVTSILKKCGYCVDSTSTIGADNSWRHILSIKWNEPNTVNINQHNLPAPPPPPRPSNPLPKGDVVNLM